SGSSWAGLARNLQSCRSAWHSLSVSPARIALCWAAGRLASDERLKLGSGIGNRDVPRNLGLDPVGEQLVVFPEQAPRLHTSPVRRPLAFPCRLPIQAVDHVLRCHLGLLDALLRASGDCISDVYI